MWLICKSLEGKLSLFILLFLILMTTQSTWDYSFAIKPFIHIHTVHLCAVLSLSYTHTLLAQLSGASLGSVSSHILAWGMEKTGIEQHTLLVNDPLFLLSLTRPYTIQYSMSLQYHEQTLCQLPVGEERNGRERVEVDGNGEEKRDRPGSVVESLMMSCLMAFAFQVIYDVQKSLFSFCFILFQELIWILE